VGDDCDDTDPAVYGGEGCRPEAPCTHPSAADLQAWAPGGASDITFDAECRAYVSTIISGLDYVYVIDGTGVTAVYPGTADYDIGAVAVDAAATVFVGWSEPVLGVGVQSGGALTGIYAESMAYGTHWENVYLSHAPSSIVADGSCVWVPQAAGDGTVGCVSYAGVLGVVASPGGWVESVAFAGDGTLWASVEGDLHVVDTTTGATAVVASLGEAVLDMAFDYNDDLYVQLVSGDVVVVDHDTLAVSTFVESSSQGKLAITPDGALVRLVAAPVAAGTFEEWVLP
jgi:hypothetical protein